MILAIDIGNTNIVVGCCKDNKVSFVERISTNHTATELEYAVSIKTILELYNIDFSEIDGAIISSVVPTVTITMKRAIKKITGCEAMIIGPGIKTGLSIVIDNPAQLGSDLVVDAVAGIHEYGAPIIIFDLGTATTISVVDKNNNYIGGVIMPGMGISLNAMVSGTSQLPRISLEEPKKIIGSNTVDCMKSGILYGTASSMDGMIERIKEEIGLGHSVKSAIKAGFSKALSAILDGNITTLIAAAVLYFRGSGTVKGFASTLAIGIVLSMFTALFITKGALYALYAVGFEAPKFYGTKKDGKIINFLGKKNICFILSIAVIVAGWAGMALHKGQTGYILNYGMDFTGGTSTNVTFNEDMSLDDISAKVVPVVSKITGDADVQTQKVAGTNEVIIKTKTLDVEQRQQLEDAMVENFGVDAEKITAESISGAVSTEMKKDAVWAVTIATVLMLLYIWFRFKDIRFAASAILALVHDVMVVVTFYSLAKWSVGSTFIACMLTIVGYSINATIVIFDRIRENLALKKAGSKQTLEEIVNLSITQTFTRSINTSLTTFIMVFVLFLLGVSSIREFALPLMVGIVCGTYSSVCVTGALWYVLTTRKQKKAEK